MSDSCGGGSQGDLTIDFEAFCSAVMEMLKLYGTQSSKQLKSEVYEHCATSIALRSVTDPLTSCIEHLKHQ